VFAGNAIDNMVTSTLTIHHYFYIASSC